MSETEKEPPLARKILGYFVRNPRAADTLEGIARWRLLEEEIRRQLDETERALRWLVSHGFLDQVPISRRDNVFRLKGEKIDEIRKFLGQEESGGGKERES